MAEHRPNLAPKALAKTMLKRVPGLVAGVHHLRAIWWRVQIAVTARAIAWGTGTRARRLLVYKASTDRLVLAVHPQESYLVNASDKLIGRSLYVGGQFDFWKFERACALIRTHVELPPDTVLIDTGANLGSICIPATRRGLVDRAIAFELDPDNTRLLRINALLNGVEDRIDIRNIAVGAAPGEVTVQHSVSNFGDHRVRAAREGDKVLPMVPLDSIVQDLDLSRAILWMDIQGYEAFALQGARQLIAAGVPLITEFSREELDSTGSFDTFLSLVTKAGYAVFYDLNAPKPEATPLRRAALEALSERLARQGTFTDLLFLPASAA